MNGKKAKQLRKAAKQVAKEMDCPTEFVEKEMKRVYKAITKQ